MTLHTQAQHTREHITYMFSDNSSATPYNLQAQKGVVPLYDATVSAAACAYLRLSLKVE